MFAGCGRRSYKPFRGCSTHHRRTIFLITSEWDVIGVENVEKPDSATHRTVKGEGWHTSDSATRPWHTRMSVNKLKWVVTGSATLLRTHRLTRLRTWDFHSHDRGSNPLGCTIIVLLRFFYVPTRTKKSNTCSFLLCSKKPAFQAEKVECKSLKEYHSGNPVNEVSPFKYVKAIWYASVTERHLKVRILSSAPNADVI